MDEVAAEAGNVKVVRQSFHGTHGDSSHMLSTVVLSNKNQTCRGGEDVTIKAREIRKGFIYEINILERKWTSCLRKKRI